MHNSKYQCHIRDSLTYGFLDLIWSVTRHTDLPKTKKGGKKIFTLCTVQLAAPPFPTPFRWRGGGVTTRVKDVEQET